LGKDGYYAKWNRARTEKDIHVFGDDDPVSTKVEKYD